MTISTSTTFSPTDRSRLLADVATAASIVSPSWPLTTFVAVNPLGALTDRRFDDALAEGRRWFDADGRLPLADARRMYADGRISDADLDAALMQHDPLFATEWTVRIGDQQVDVLDVLRHDLVHGPEGLTGRGGPQGSPDVDDIITTWCAAYVDDDDVAWAMPDRDLGFYRAWKSVARHDRALRSLAGRGVRRAIDALPDDPVAAIHGAFEQLGMATDADRRTQLRAWLLRTPGWAGFARWCDDWAPADHRGVLLRAVDLIAARAAIETLVPASHRTVAPANLGALLSLDRGVIDRRLGAIVDRFGLPDQQAADDLRSVLATLDDDARRGVFLAALEIRTRDRLLSTIDSIDASAAPGVDAERDLTAQMVCCIDVRSEGLRRNLEALGAYETFGFAGFFGVPVRWRPLGADHGQARCPVLVTPQHEVVEQALDPEADRHVQRQTLRSGVAEAKHHATTGLGSPFAMAESLGWFTGPVAAARTLLPGGRPGPDRPHRTRAQVSREAHAAGDAATIDAVRSGLSLDERTLFAEAIIATIGFRRFASIVVLCGHGAATVNNPHGSSLDCGACGGAPGGASARIAAEILNDVDVRAALLERSIDVPDTTRFVAAEHDTIADTVEFFDLDRLPDSFRPALDQLRRDLETAGAANARERAAKLPGGVADVRRRGGDWAETRQEWGLAGNAAFVIGPRSITAGCDLGGRAFLHSYDADLDTEGTALETIMTAPLVVGQWISSQYLFSSTDPHVFGAGDKMLHNPVGGVGVLLGQSGDLRVGLPEQSVSIGDHLVHEPVRLHAVIQAPIERIEAIIRRNDTLASLFDNEWLHCVARPHADERWSVRRPGGTWVTWWPADTGAPVDAPAPAVSVLSEVTTS